MRQQTETGRTKKKKKIQRKITGHPLIRKNSRLTWHRIETMPRAIFIERKHTNEEQKKINNFKQINIGAGHGCGR